jgi:hypothetical protein
MSHVSNRRKTARYRAGLKAKYRKERMRKKGLMKVKRPGGRLKFKQTKEAKRASIT